MFGFTALQRNNLLLNWTKSKISRESNTTVPKQSKINNEMMRGGLEDVLGGEAMIQKMQRLNHVI